MVSLEKICMHEQSGYVSGVASKQISGGWKAREVLLPLSLHPYVSYLMRFPHFPQRVILHLRTPFALLQQH
jgi:hypothetical protein